MSAPLPRKVHVVIHTHWDREWYFTHETFRARLVEVMRRVATLLESGKLPHFLLDGQVAAYQDFLAAAEPELSRRVRALIAHGCIGIGPWQVMADEFLVNGESLWRNLETGLRSSRAHGGAQLTGYLPDTFGHVAQMPQLLRHFGLPCAVVWRGADSPDAVFDWIAPDGSTLPTLYLVQGYYQIPLHGPEWHNALEKYLIDAERTASEGPLLLMHGGDHLAPQPDLREKIDAYNASQSRWLLELTTLDAHAAKAVASCGSRHTIKGELRSNVNAFVLPDVLSTRRYLKRMHQEIEDRLTGEIEPLLAQWADVAGHVEAYLAETWRRLLALQAHDSICGCSIDAVHEAMEIEFSHLRDRLDAMRNNVLSNSGLLCADLHGPGSVFADDRVVTLFNPLPKSAGGTHVFELFLEGDAADRLNLRDAAGHEWPSAILECRTAHRLVSPLDGFPDRRAGFAYEVAVQGTVAGLGVAELRVMPVAAQVPQSLHAAPPGEMRLENAHLAVELDDRGGLTLLDRIGGKRIERVLDLASELDAGDTYNFSPPASPHLAHGVRWALVDSRDVGLARQWTLKTKLRLPAGLNDARSGAAENSVECEGILRLRLLGDEPCVDARLIWTNRAKDQRTRLLIPLDASVGETHADSAFAWMRRPVLLAKFPGAPSRREMPVAVMPSHSAIAAGSIGLCHRGLQEFEVMDIDGTRQLGLTLVRSVGWLSRRDLVTRGVGAGPDLETPGAQCLRTDHYDFRFGFAESGEQGGLDWLHRAERFRKPVVAYTGQAPGWRAPINIGNQNIMVSAVRTLGREIEIRVWNPCTTAQRIALAANPWRRSGPFGERLNWTDTIAPHEIATYRRSAD